MNLQKLILEQTRQYNDKVFLINANEQISYTEVLFNAQKLAYYFKLKGLDKGQYLVHHQISTLLSISVFYASQLLGAIFVPINQNWTFDSCTQLMSMLSPCIYLGDLNFKLAKTSVSASELDNLIQDQNAPLLKDFPVISPKDTSTILFSSGTTGKPKGILLSHETLYCKAKLFTEHFDWQASDTLLSLGEIHTIDRLRTGCIAPLFIGLRVITDESKKRFFSHLANLISIHNCTLVSLTPTLIRQFIYYHEEIDQSLLKSLRFVGAPASLITSEEKQEFTALYGKRVLSYYGLSETGGFCAALSPKSDPKLDTATGYPIACELRVVDQSGRDLAAGELGELLIRSEIPFMQGYLNNHELSEQTIKDGWLHTADLAYLSEDGALNIRGRMGDVFKNAYDELIFPDEIESAVMKHDLVSECVVFDYRGSFGETRIAAVVSTLEQAVDKNLLLSELKSLTSRTLGTHKCPSMYEIVHQFPRTSNGKIIRHEVKEKFSRAVV
jgi:acyl-coenzyme A synthetase/AMP-(fatty) acid ligase